MLVKSKIVGQWNGSKYVFDTPREKILATGPKAYALGGSSSTSEYVPTGPWAPQIPYVQQLFQQANQLYGQGAPGYYPGSTVVSPTPQLQQTQQNAIAGGTNAANTAGAGSQIALGAAGAAGSNPVLQAGNNALPSFYQSLSTLGNVGQSATGIAQGLSPQISQLLSGVTGQNTQMPGTAAPQIGAGGLDLTSSLQQSLQGGALNPYLGQIADAATRESTRQFQTQIMPSINSGAAATGNVGSSRQGVAQGLAAQGLQQQQGDVLAQLYGNAFNQGAQERQGAQQLIYGAQGQNVQAQQSQQQINAAIQQALTGQSLSAAQIGAGLFGTGAAAAQGAGGLAGNLFSQGGAQSLDQLYRSLATIPGLTGAQTSGLSSANTGALQDYSLQQAQRDADVERYFYNAFAPYNALTQYQNFISGAYGSSQAPGGVPSFYGGAMQGNPGTVPGNTQTGGVPGSGGGGLLNNGQKYPGLPTEQSGSSLMNQGATNSLVGLFDPVGGTVGHISTALGMGGIQGLFGNNGGSHARNWNAFNAAYPGTTVDAQGNYVLPQQPFGGSVVNQQQLDNLAGTWYGATYAPDGNQTDWQTQYQQALQMLGIPGVPQQTQQPQQAWRISSPNRAYAF